MGDSDEEYDRRRVRDKFKRERSDYSDRYTGSRGREDYADTRDSGGGWGANSSGSRDRMNRSGGDGRYSSDRYGNQRRDRYGSPGDRSDMSPPMKRVRNTRPEWEDRGNYQSSNNFDYSHSGGAWNPLDSGLAHTLSSAAAAAAAFNSNASPATHQSTGPTQPPMMTFKQFLGTQDDSVDDMEAVRKYNDYKTEFKKQQISDFFTAHKEEECGLTYRQYNLPGQESYFILSVNFINCFFDVFAHGSEKRLKSICFILFNILSYLSQVVDLISLIIYNQSIKSEVS